ncbi:hypothetical protein E0H39_29525 [Rhizobium leguminosarum bv. viciae]|uniref:hypothetical protein n=1 Tax=Rhizobium leguminosarum TaxID=384 RepID=UPI00103ED520|nr:hypothetical protein [Rhizobium leguminosarum]TBY57960.1 hypothetical protein E0H39_29525 [Rhizobium leguminosarum bv. viciae]
MSNIFTSRDPASAAAGQLGIMSVLMADFLTSGHEAGLEAMERGRERRAAQKYADELNAAQGRADELGRVAIRAVRHVASLEAEVRRLRNALEQRQCYIDRMNARVKAGA